jgi:phosphomannomutase
MLDQGVFKAYDVRGVYPGQLDEDGAYRIGRGYVEEFEPRAIAVGRDMRVSSPAMARAVVEGAADGGADVADIGPSPGSASASGAGPSARRTSGRPTGSASSRSSTPPR